MDQPDNLASRMKYVRIEVLRLSQYEFSRAINITQARVSQMERGLAAPSYEVLETLFKQFGISSDYIVNNVGSPKEIRPAEETDLLRRMADSISSYQERMDERVGKIEEYLFKTYNEKHHERT